MWLLALAACQQRQQGNLDQAVAASAERVSVPAQAAAAGCPLWGLWSECSVRERLERAGLVLDSAKGEVRHDFLRVPGIVLHTYRAEVQLFLYPSAAERRRDTDRLDSLEVAPRGKRVVWPEPALLVTSGNLAAIVLSWNERLAERIALALEAGLPARPY
jgi:hypothetical protein